MAGNLQGNVQEMSGKVPETIREFSGKNPGNVRELSLVYLLLPTFRETLQGGFLEVFNLISGQCSVYFPGKNSGENPRKSLFSLLNSFKRPLKGPNKPVRTSARSPVALYDSPSPIEFVRPGPGRKPASSICGSSPALGRLTG